MSEWRTIDSAPLSGAILTWCPTWNKGSFMLMDMDYAADRSNGAMDMLQPTHWMPLPEPPESGRW